MERMINDEQTVDLILTSPFYNTNRSSQRHNHQKARDMHEYRYDIHIDNLTDDEYIEFTRNLFNNYDKILKKMEVYYITYHIVRRMLLYYG